MKRGKNFLICEPLSSIDIANELGENNKYINSVLARLKKMELIKAFQTKKGPGGYSVHGIPMLVVTEIEKAKGNI